MIKIKKHTEGDSRVAKELPTFRAFDIANDDHRQDVKNVIGWFATTLVQWTKEHDWTKREVMPCRKRLMILIKRIPSLSSIAPEAGHNFDKGAFCDDENNEARDRNL